MFTATDYDKLRQIMDESPQKEALISKLLESQDITLRTISHEIRNPLTLVYSTLQLIESQHPEVAAYKYWGNLREDVEYMKQLLEELSSYNNGEELSFASISSSSFLKSICLSFAASLLDTEIEFSSRIEPALPDIIGDPIKLKEVLLNLLRNAKDAVEKDGNICLHAYVHENLLRIDITDNGCGIPKDDIAGIFEPFVTHKTNGTGLGLAIADRIAAAHSGSLTVQSTLCVATTFTLSLPIEKHT